MEDLNAIVNKRIAEETANDFQFQGAVWRFLGHLDDGQTIMYAKLIGMVPPVAGQGQPMQAYPAERLAGIEQKVDDGKDLDFNVPDKTEKKTKKAKKEKK